MKKSVLHKISMVVAVISIGAAAVATEALSRERVGTKERIRRFPADADEEH
jgi:hypothetical protein